MLPVVTFNYQIISVILTHLTCSLSRCLPKLRSLDLNLGKKHHRLQIRFILSMPGNEKHRLLFYLNHQAGIDPNPFSFQEAQATLTQCNLSSPTGNSAMQFQQRDVTQVQLQPKTPNILLVYHGKLWSPKTQSQCSPNMKQGDERRSLRIITDENRIFILSQNSNIAS